MTYFWLRITIVIMFIAAVFKGARDLYVWIGL